MNPLLPIGAAAAALLLLAGRDPVRKFVRRQKKGGLPPLIPFHTQSVKWKVTKDKETGLPKQLRRIKVTESPTWLAAEASRRLGRKIPVDTFALAALIASETGSGHPLAKAAVAHAAITAAKRDGNKSIITKLAPDGFFGSQHGRFASTRQAPTITDIEMAEAVRSGRVDNPSPGADQWDSPSAQNILLARGEDGYTLDADELAQRRLAAGKEPVTLPGIDPNYLRLWRPAA